MLLIGLYLGFLINANADEVVETTRGQVIGGSEHVLPAWFKESFLEIADDVDEASEAGRQVMLFFDLNACPYCTRMLEESFNREPNSSYIQTHFDVIAVNIRGDREIAFNDDVSMTEKQLADRLAVFATPALVFLDESNQTVLRVNGYRAPQRFRQVLEFVATRSYRSASLADYLKARLDRNTYALRANPRFSENHDLSSIEGPVMLIFEDGGCYDCSEFHDTIFNDIRVKAELDAFTVVRLNTDSDETVIDFQGEETTTSRLAERYSMIYRPGILLFEDHNLIRRHDSLIFPHHLSESLRYVGRSIYRQTDYRSFTEQYRETLLQAGIDINLGRPSHQNAP